MGRLADDQSLKNEFDDGEEAIGFVVREKG
jgi:hypothetical protein